MAAARSLVRRLLRRRRAIPLSDATPLRFALRRTTIVRLVLGAALVALAAVAVWRAAELNPRPVSFIPASSTSIVVIDQSKSVYISSYKRIAQLIRKLAAADVPVGLVAFSDTAYEMLPPGARGSELSPLLRFYTPGHGGSNVDPETLYAANPWQDVFSGGTKISSGLDLAQSLIRIENDKDVKLEIVPLFPVEDDVFFFQRFVPKRDFVKPSQLRISGTSDVRRRLIADTPWPLLVVGGFLLLALAANELTCGRLQLPRLRGQTA